MADDLTQKNALSIIICHELESDALTVEHVKQGVEEEQIPAHLINSSGCSMDLARLAAESSLLGIGVGIDQRGVITLSHFRMPSDQPVIQVSSGNDPRVARIIGANAARLFKGLPFVNWEI